MRVEIHTAEPVVCQFVSDDHIIRHRAHAVAVREKANSRAADLYAVSGRNVFRDGVVVDAEVCGEREIRWMLPSLAVPWVRPEDNPALQWVIHNRVMNNQIIVAFPGLIAN